MKITLNGLENAQGMVIRVTEGGVEIDCTAVAESSCDPEREPPDSPETHVKPKYDLSTEDGWKRASRELK